MADEATFNNKSASQNRREVSFWPLLYSSQFSAFTLAESFTIQQQ